MPERDELLQIEHDGIQEYDNDLPRWWISLFWLTIVFAVVYTGYLHFGPGQDQFERLAQDMKELESRATAQAKQEEAEPVGEEQLESLLSDQVVLNKGKEVFAGKCLACHAAQAQGLVGPNLTDDYWIHGATLTDIRKIIIIGVPAKGMLAWKGILSEQEINAVTVFIRSLRGSNPPNPKKPEGELIELD